MAPGCTLGEGRQASLQPSNASIPRQHSCKKNLARAGGVVDPVKSFLSSSLSTMQHLAVVSHTICMYAEVLTNFGDARVSTTLARQ